MSPPEPPVPGHVRARGGGRGGNRGGIRRRWKVLGWAGPGGAGVGSRLRAGAEGEPRPRSHPRGAAPAAARLQVSAGGGGGLRVSVRHPPRGRPRNPRPLGGRARCRPRVPRSARCSPLDRRFRCPPPLPPAYPVLPSLPPPPRGGVPGSGSVPSFRAVSQREGVAFPPIPAAGTMAEPFVVESPDVAYSKDFIEAQYTYSTAHVCREGGVTKVGGAGTPTDGTAAPPRWVPTSRPPPRAAGPALLHALHLPHGAARPPPGADAGGLGGQQRHHGDGGRVGQPPGAVLDDQDRAQGGCGGRGRPCRVPSFSGGGLGGCWALWRSLTLAFCPPPLESQLLRLAAAGLHCMPGCRPHRRRLRAIPGPAAHGAPQRHRL